MDDAVGDEVTDADVTATEPLAGCVLALDEAVEVEATPISCSSISFIHLRLGGDRLTFTLEYLESSIFATGDSLNL